MERRRMWCDAKKNDFNDKTKSDRRMDQIVTVQRVPLKIENGTQGVRDSEGEISEIWRPLKWEEINTCEKTEKALGIIIRVNFKQNQKDKNKLLFIREKKKGKSV